MPSAKTLSFWRPGFGRAFEWSLILTTILFGNAFQLHSQAPALQSPSRAAREVAADIPLEQLQARLNEERLSPEEIIAASNQALRLQADDKLPWDERWGDFVELAREKGKISDSLWHSYLLGAVRIDIRVPTAAKRSDGLPIWIENKSVRTGSHGARARVSAVGEADLSGIALNFGKANQNARRQISVSSGNGLGWTEDLKQKHYVSVKPGEQTCHYRFRLQIADTKKAKGDPPTLLPERVVEGTIPWRLMAEDEAPSMPVLQPDESLRSEIEKSLRVNYILRDDRDTSLVQVMIQVDHPPTGMAFDVALRVGGDAWPLGPVAWAKNRAAWWAFDADLPVDIKKADVVFIPSVQAGAKARKRDKYELINLNSIWDGREIAIRAIDIRSQRLKMIKVSTLSGPEAREYALEQMNPSDPAILQLARDGDFAKARTELERRLASRPGEARTIFHLGCIVASDGEIAGATNLFTAAQRLDVPLALRRQIQSQLRRMCAVWLYAAEAGDAAAMSALGAAYENGRGVTLDLQEAKRWYRNGSNAGNAGAMCRLAAIYGREGGATIHTEKAHEWYREQSLEWYRRSAALGNTEAKQWMSEHSR